MEKISGHFINEPNINPPRTFPRSTPKSHKCHIRKNFWRKNMIHAWAIYHWQQRFFHWHQCFNFKQNLCFLCATEQFPQHQCCIIFSLKKNMSPDSRTSTTSAHQQLTINTKVNSISAKVSILISISVFSAHQHKFSTLESKENQVSPNLCTSRISPHQQLTINTRVSFTAALHVSLHTSLFSLHTNLVSIEKWFISPAPAFY